MRVTLIACLLAATAFNASPALGCSILSPSGWRPPTPEEAFYHATLVLHVRALADSEQSGPVRLQVVQRLKGWWWSMPLGFETRDSGACGFGAVKAGQEYVFFFYDGWSIIRTLPSWNQPRGTSDEILETLAPKPGVWRGVISAEGAERDLRSQVHMHMNSYEAADPTNPHPDRAEVVENFWMHVGMRYLEARDPTNPHPGQQPPPFGRLPRKPPSWSFPAVRWTCPTGDPNRPWTVCVTM